MSEAKTETQAINLEKKVKIRSIAPWSVGFPRKETSGDINIPPKGTALVTIAEIIAQSQHGNKLINGLDEYGSHATVIIEDELTRKELNFDSEDGKRKQQVINEENILEVFKIKSFKTFETALKELAITRAEKSALLEIIEKCKINEYDKVSYAKEFCKFSLR